ncbi:MAG: HAD-IA family hydrolase [Chloroflexota bacterium]
MTDRPLTPEPTRQHPSDKIVGDRRRTGPLYARVAVFDLDNTVVHSRIDFTGIRHDLIGLLSGADALQEPAAEVSRRSIGGIIALAESWDGERGTSLGLEAWNIVLRYEISGMREATVEDGAGRVLAELRTAGLRLAVLTNNARPATLDALERFRLHACFDLVLTRDEVPMKPDPAGIHRAVGHFGSSAAETVMIGDSWLDGAAAVDAGVPFIGFRARADVLRERGIHPWSVVQSLDELPALLARQRWGRQDG